MYTYAVCIQARKIFQAALCFLKKNRQRIGPEEEGRQFDVIIQKWKQMANLSHIIFRIPDSGAAGAQQVFES